MAQNKNKMMLVLLFTAFAVPVLLAKLALEFDYFNKASTNKGQLLSPVIDTSSFYTLEQPSWQIAYFHKGECDASCDNAMYSLSQVWSALGKHRDRVTPMVLHSQAKALQQQLAQYPVLKTKQLEASALEQHQQYLQSETGVYIIDTLNQAVLFYPVTADKNETVMIARDVLADLRKLLKLSRIG